jgi:hypothetical protein
VSSLNFIKEHKLIESVLSFSVNWNLSVCINGKVIREKTDAELSVIRIFVESRYAKNLSLPWIFIGC